MKLCQLVYWGFNLLILLRNGYDFGPIHWFQWVRMVVRNLVFMILGFFAFRK